MDNAEILETLGTQEEFEDTKEVINNGQCWDTGNIGHTRRVWRYQRGNQ